MWLSKQFFMPLTLNFLWLHQKQNKTRNRAGNVSLNYSSTQSSPVMEMQIVSYQTDNLLIREMTAPILSWTTHVPVFVYACTCKCVLVGSTGWPHPLEWALPALNEWRIEADWEPIITILRCQFLHAFNSKCRNQTMLIVNKKKTDTHPFWRHAACPLAVLPFAKTFREPAELSVLVNLGRRSCTKCFEWPCYEGQNER